MGRRKKHKKNKLKEPEYALFFDGTICPYCGEESILVDDQEVYNKSYGGKCYVCWPCGAWVGCHKNSDKSLGRLANKELRQAKIEAHEYFDNLWRRSPKKYARTRAYKWLSREMETPPVLTHIGMFDIEQCKKVVELCKPYYKP